MGVIQSTTLNTDSNGKATSGQYGNLGAGVSDWYTYMRAADGGIAGIGATTDASAVTGNGNMIQLLKALRDFFKAEDAVAGSGDYGIGSLAARNDALATLTTATGDYSLIGVGQAGELFNTAAPPLGTSQAAAVALSEAATTALATNLVVKNSAGTLYKIRGINNNAAVRYIQIANLTALGADGTVPVEVFQVAAASAFNIDFGPYGRRFSTGIVICTSTTLATKTIGAADLWVNASYK